MFLRKESNSKKTLHTSHLLFFVFPFSLMKMKFSTTSEKQKTQQITLLGFISGE